MKESLKIPSDVKNIRKVSTRIVDLLMERGLDKSAIFDIRLSLEESILNAIEHGNKNDKSLKVAVSFEIDDEKISITVEDEGAGFDRLALPDPTKGEEILRTHGRGVYLIHKLMDGVKYNEKGNSVTMSKSFKPSGGRDADKR